jgi:hypothetical protein
MLLTLVGALLMAQPVAAVAAPDNDDRADALQVRAIPFQHVQDVADATVEDDEPEPNCAPSGNTVWFELQLPRRTQVVVDTAGSGYDTVAAVYTPELAEVACNDDAGTLQAKVGFTAERDATYLIQIGAYGGELDAEYELPELVVTIDRGRVRTYVPRQESYSFRGLMASAYHWDDDDTDGDDTSYGGYGVGLRQGRESGSWSGGAQRVDEVTVYWYEGSVDLEKETETFTDWWGYAALESGGIDRKLTRANVDQQVWVEGITCTGPIIDWDEFDEDEWPDVEYDCTELGDGFVDVEVDWEGRGAITTSRGQYRETDEWGTWSSRYRARERQASVMGRVTGELLDFDLAGAEGYLADVNESFTHRPARR